MAGSPPKQPASRRRRKRAEERVSLERLAASAQAKRGAATARAARAADLTEEVAAHSEAAAAVGVGRPRTEIDWGNVGYLASIGCSKEEIAAALDVALGTLTQGANGEIFDGIYAGGVMKANVSIRRVLFGALRGRLVDPLTGEIEIVPIEERIGMAKFLATKKRFLALDDAVDPDEARRGSIDRSLIVVEIGGDKAERALRRLERAGVEIVDVKAKAIMEPKNGDRGQGQA